jgi:hypothetical protein
MLGCQDFCGYYEWTFDYLRKKFGQAAVETFWREAIAGDSQSHYVAAGQEAGLRGLYNCWNHTGDSEKCDWTVSLDEEQNHLRLDMRQCPSKGFLLSNNLNADEDYCDHCIGWIGPALEVVGAKVVAHEHNHCGQCWWHVALEQRATCTSESSEDIRNDPRWSAGYIDRFENHQRASIVGEQRYQNSNDVIESLFKDVDRISILGDAFSATSDTVPDDIGTGIVTDKAYLQLPSDAMPRCVVLGYDIQVLHDASARYVAAESQRRSVLLHTYLPNMAHVAFSNLPLPRPLPILPLLIRKNAYKHLPNGHAPSTSCFALLVASALGKMIDATGLSPAEIEFLGNLR